ncbi:uncharacterized protein LOC106866461 [Brachypodium distachyon]|uniref:Uncharacterized protein n=1 Tax=Brachypodium distachyon TaxID=15368 RepID=A0A0Q3IHL1_BRADI|nr:uncharacterized protein LOC106866461 [Brachypodium distachyon]XP_014756194.1 uncharacterized protein LOC106866461 [Brachypodium distachyon]KQK00116.1 hypothetical protein BRADI_3g47435v3 [Brachypodium distachyon]PNT68955.1 hypothetical protein BRADI_3g47435v3 [Brachypodium distachyon]|eukprot:XP_014756193.1 uncharacterized protein LOC106866461 [Brachypodium distachyon]
MAIEAPLSEEEIRSMVDQGIVDPKVESSLRAEHTVVSTTLELHTDLFFPSLAHLDLQDSREGYAVSVRDRMAADGERLRHGAAVFDDGRDLTGEEAALVSELRRQAAWCDARRAEADALAADVRRLRDGHLREMATTGDPRGELIDAAAFDLMEFLFAEIEAFVAPEGGCLDEVAGASIDLGPRFAATFVGLSERARSCAEAYTASEDAAVAEGLRRRADEVEALCADPEDLVAQIRASAWWRSGAGGRGATW